jgi:hypothetical protein
MILLMVECPSTGQVMSTEITDGIDRLPKVGTRMRCPLCDQEHFWTSREVRFAECQSRAREVKPKHSWFASII